MMMKKSLLLIAGILFLFGVSTAHAALTYLPESDYVSGVSIYNTGSGNIYVQYAVYDTSIQTLEGYDGDEQYVYAYQVLNYSSVDIAAIAILGFDPLAVTSDSLDVSDELDTNTTDGMDATTLLDAEDVQALYAFDGGAVVQGDTSWFLLIYSDYDWVKGSYEINPSDTDIAVPGEDSTGSGSDNNNVPEPATLALLLGGGVLSLMRKK